jgi:P pilus assembly chaperone PapD
MIRSTAFIAAATVLLASNGAAWGQDGAATAPVVGAIQSGTTPTGADLNISPRRVTFDDTERSASVYVFNQGDAPATYTVELVDRVMSADGQIRAVADAPDAPRSPSAMDFIQYTPRRVTLQPKESQVIRIRMRPPGGAAAGEYRTHLTVTALPPETSGFTAAQAAEANPDSVALQITALFSVSIPLIIREGAVDARAGIENAILMTPTETTPNGAVTLDLVRLGANSVYGDVEIHAGTGSADHVVGLVRGIAVYPEIGRRTVVAPLALPLTPGEPVRVVYIDDDTKVGSVLATLAAAPASAPRTQ